MKVHVLNQLLAAFTAFLTIFYAGMWRGYTSLVISRFRNGKAPIPLTSDGISWMVALPDFGGLLGAFPVAHIVDRFGRLVFLRLTFLLFIIGAVLILVAPSEYDIFFAAFLIGVGKAVGFTISALYVAEIAQAEYRGALSNMSVLMVTGATAVTFTFGPHISLRHLTWASLVCALVGFFLTFFIVESPYFHFFKNNEKRAAAALARLRDGKKTLKNEFELEAIRKNVQNAAEGRSWTELITNKANRRALMIVVAKSALKRAGGWNSITTYGPAILPADSSWSPDVSVQITLWVMVVFSLLGMSLVDWIGRKPLQIVATLAMSLIIGVLAIFFYFYQNTTVDVSLLVFIPHVGLILGGIFYPLGQTENIYRGELLSPSIKGRASAVVLTAKLAISFVCNKIFFAVDQSIGVYFMYAMFSIFYFIDMLFTAVCIFETKGKTLADIQDELNS